MKNNLLLTTALVALSMPAYAGQTIDAALTVVSDGSTNTISASEYKEYSREAGSGNARFGVIGYSDNKSLLQVIGGTFENNRNDYVGGVLATGLSGSLNVSGGSVFKNNHSYYDGGAIGNYGGLNISGATFEGNTAQLWGENYDEPVTDAEAVGGGAISLGSVSDTEIASITDTVFKNNISGKNGGAIGTRLGANGDNSAAKLNMDATFTGNEAHNNGGAIYNTFYAGEKGVTIKGSFVENTAGGDGGAIYNDGEKDKAGNNGGKMTILSGSEFKDNRAEGFGGAIRNRLGDLTIEDGVTFSGNEAYTGGAITSGSSKNLIVDTITIGSAIFDGNHASADAGAVGVYRKGVLTGTIFKNNTAGITIAGVEASNESDGGGAFMLGGTANATLNNVTFEKNQASGRGGAISARQDAGYTLTVQEKSKFVENSAGTYGGAIVNVYAGAVNVTNVDFEKNSAGKSGGAIYNGEAINYGSSSEGIMSTNHGIINISGANNFTNNTAKELGGAIYNDDGGTLNLEGTNVFSGNTAGGKANDIHNTGTLNVAGNLTLDGGITGNGTVVFNNATLKATLDKTTIAAKTVTIKDSTLNLILGDDVKVGKHDFVTATEKQDGVFDITNTLYNITHLTTGEINVETKSTTEITDSLGVTDNEANALIAATSASSENQDFNNVANALSAAAQAGDASAAKEAQKLGADVNPIVSSQEAGSHDVLFGVVSNELNGDSGAMAGMSSGDVFKKASAWIRGLFNKADHEATSKSSGFNADTYGVAMGIDKEINSDTRLGFGYANSQTDIESAGRDTDVDTNSFFVYSQYKPANWYVNTILAYSWSEYDETKSVMGANAGAKYDVDTIALQSMYGYETKFKGHDLTPEFGFRYLHTNQDSYTDKLGTTVAENSEDVLTLVAGAKVAKNYTLENGAVLRPELRAAVTYDLFDADNSANVMLANGASYAVDGEKLNRLGFEFGAKVATNVTDKVEVSAGYLTRVREDYQDHTVTFDARYNF